MTKFQVDFFIFILLKDTFMNIVYTFLLTLILYKKNFQINDITLCRESRILYF